MSDVLTELKSQTIMIFQRGRVILTGVNRKDGINEVRGENYETGGLLNDVCNKRFR